MSIELSNESGHQINEPLYLDLAAFVLRSLHVHPDTEVSLLFVETEAMERLHEQWMGQPGATDVLSFPMDELRPGRPDAPTPAGLLGDVVVCPAVARVQAVAAQHDIDEEMKLLVTHGMLHLLGFDHADPKEEAEMFAVQRQILFAYERERNAP